jgi:hypothetical protein
MQVSEWLNLHPQVAGAIAWEDRGRVTTYPHWSPARKAELEAEFQAYAGGKPTALDDPPPNLLKVDQYDFAFTRIDPAHAWKLYLSHLACGLWCEIAKKVAWSITDYPATALAILYDSRQMFKWRSTPTAYESGYVGADSPGYDCDIGGSGTVVPAPPYQVLHFLRTAGILEPLALRTPLPGPPPLLHPGGPAARLLAIHKMVDWCRYLVHFGGSEGPLVMQAYWGYPGFSPVMRVLEGTVNPANGGANITKHYTAGCGGTSGLLRAVLRVINIPVEIRRPPPPNDHAQPFFPLENIGLCHGDDPYCRRLRYFLTQTNVSTQPGFYVWSAPFPVGELFITGADYDQWFGPNVAADTVKANVDRRSKMLDMKYLPYFALSYYCDDLANGTTKVADYFGEIYTPAEMKQQQLWERLAQKLEEVGGYSQVSA